MNAKQFSILVVEDEPDGQELVSRMLSQSNVSVDVAGNAEEAWNFLMSNQYSAAIIDLALPERDGFELVTAIRGEADLIALPCVAMTAFHTPELKQRAMTDGFTSYFSKPLDRTRFLGEIDRILAD
jgi:CheY-like chemotaxis protein